MANVCCVCGKNISKWAKERPISEKYPNEFFCDTCYAQIAIIQKKEIVDAGKFEKAISYIDEYIASGNIKSEVCEVLESYKVGLDDKMLKVQSIRAEKEKYQYIKATNGHNFEGYKITEYIKIVTGETVLGTGFGSELAASFADFFGTKSEAFKEKLAFAREDAMEEVLSQVVKLGGNAIIGVDYNYHQFNANLIGVIISGTAVIIEKI